MLLIVTYCYLLAAITTFLNVPFNDPLCSRLGISSSCPGGLKSKSLSVARYGSTPSLALQVARVGSTPSLALSISRVGALPPSALFEYRAEIYSHSPLSVSGSPWDVLLCCSCGLGLTCSACLAFGCFTAIGLCALCHIRNSRGNTNAKTRPGSSSPLSSPASSSSSSPSSSVYFSALSSVPFSDLPTPTFAHEHIVHAREYNRRMAACCQYVSHLAAYNLLANDMMLRQHYFSSPPSSPDHSGNLPAYGQYVDDEYGMNPSANEVRLRARQFGIYF